jgi:hypothetical protein
MKKLRLVTASLLLFPWQGCTNAQNLSLQVSYNLPASDQIGAGSSGACTCTPQTSAQSTYIASGLLELDPILNPGAQYTLNLQTENYLDTTTLTDSNGNTISGPQRNDFHVQRALIDFLDTKGILPITPQATVLTSADVRPGGLQSSACIPVQAVPHDVAKSWGEAMKDAGQTSDLVVLQVQLQGVLGTDESINTGYFHFPLNVCTNCGGNAEDGLCLETRTTLVGTGHGPCCAPQDFTITCQRCGGAGEPCCTVGTPCDSMLTCKTVAATTIEICPPYNNALQTACSM